MTNNYIKALQRLNSGSRQPLPTSAALVLATHQSHNLGGNLTDFGPIAPQDAGIDTNQGIGSRILDILSRGTYASANAAKAVVGNFQGEDNNAVGAAFKGLAGTEKTTYSDVIDKASPDAPSWVKGVGGFAGDVLLDPANLIAGGALSGIKAAKAAIKGVEAVDEAGT